jgi:hypothetical protein
MRFFNDYLRSTFDSVTNFVLSISEPININTIIQSDEQQIIENSNLHDLTLISPTYPMSYISDANVLVSIASTFMVPSRENWRLFIKRKRS